MVAEELREIMARLGFRTVDEMIGRVDCLQPDAEAANGKARYLDLSLMLTPTLTQRNESEGMTRVAQDHGLDKALDNQLIKQAERAIRFGHKVTIDAPVLNTHRVVGATLSHEVVKHHAAKGLPDDTIRIRLEGSAGQSFGAFLAPGITLELEGDANDYVGKGLSGGRIVIYPPKESTFDPFDNVIVGNVVLYGATSGTAFFRGYAAERFCVRNSGAHAVIEGAGDHACEYMTGGRVVVLGPTGRNFAAGMSGGIAYVLADRSSFKDHCCNPEMVDLEELDDETEISFIRGLVADHLKYTGSTVAEQVLENWEDSVSSFIKVMPREYKKVLAGSQTV
jgi:glutamate synthase (NADPH/NADH)